MGHDKTKKMNFMKKILLVGGVVASFFLFSGILAAHAQQAGLTLGVISINGLSPDPATNQIAITGFASGGHRWNGEYYCGGNVEIDIPVPVTDGYYVFDNPSAKGGYAYDLTQTHAGVPNTCPPNARQYEAYTYSIGFIDNTHISSLGAGVHTITLCAKDAGCDTQTFTITGAGTGAIAVTSENSVVTSTLVSSSWQFTSGPDDPCQSGQCYGTAAEYANQTLGAYTLNPGTNPTGYAFQSVQRESVAVAENPFVSFFIKSLFNEAEAVSVCGFVNGGACNPGNTFSLANPGDMARFVILWDPIANLNVSSPSVSLSNGTPETINVGNNGIQGSQLTWTSSIAYGSGSGWLTVTPSSDAAGLAVGSSNTVTFQANVGALANGTYNATATFVGLTSNATPPRPSKPNTQIDVPVTLTVGGGGGGGGGTVIIISVAPSSTVSVTTPITATCSGGSGAYVWSASGPAIYSSNTGTIFNLSYDIPSVPNPPYTVTCKDANNLSDSDSVSETVTQITPACSFAANPSQITLPGSSSLTWTCINANGGCNINGVSVNPVTGTLAVSPTTNTTYTLSCKGPGGGPGSTSSVQTTVSVVGPGVIEGNP